MLLRELVVHATERFKESGIDSAEVDAQLLAGHLLGLSRGEVQSEMIRGAELSEAHAEKLTQMFGRRLLREPLQHITGVAYFRNLELAVGRGVFTPRPETEFVAQLAIDALNAAKSEAPIAVDLGTGSGAIALAMATEVVHSRVFAVEKSTEAFPFTQQNFQKHSDTSATLVLGDLANAFQELDGTVSVVASNPPYIPLDAVPRDIEVRLHDPQIALYGGADGMQVMRLVSQSAKRLLLPGGSLVVEHADSQGKQVCELLLADGWNNVLSHKDLTGRDRAVTATK
jgi:release factor glutamine methyltransferase